MQISSTATIDTGSNWVTTTGQVYGASGTTFNKIGSGTLYVAYGMGDSGFNGNVDIQAGSLVDCAVGNGQETDAFGNSTVVNVAAGATWDDSWGNGEDLGGISGAGTILAQNSTFMAPSRAGYHYLLRHNPRCGPEPGAVARDRIDISHGETAAGVLR